MSDFARSAYPDIEIDHSDDCKFILYSGGHLVEGDDVYLLGKHGRITEIQADYVKLRTEDDPAPVIVGMPAPWAVRFLLEFLVGRMGRFTFSIPDLYLM